MKYLTYVVVLLAMLAATPQTKASSVICDQIIYTETNSPNIILNIKDFTIVNITKIGFFKTRVTVYPWDLKGKGNGGTIRNGFITFPISRCLYITDAINSIDNLKWYININ